MAAIDPSEPAELDENSNEPSRPRATLKLVRQADDDDDEDREEYMRALLGDSDSESDEDGESDEEEANGGPSDPSKSKKARKAAALKQLMESINAGSESDEEMEDAAEGVNGTAKADKKGKAKATSDDEEDEDEDEDSEDEDLELEEFVLCTLDPEKESTSQYNPILLSLTYTQSFQQPLDITVAENERVFFKVSGTHTIYLTGNYVIPDDDGHNHHHEVYDSDSDEEGDYDLSPDEDELELDLDDEESDDLDELEDPRITEVDTDDEEAPELAKAQDKKGKNKRSADELEDGNSLDDIMAKSLKPEANDETKLSKKQLKKLKKNNGEAAASKTAEQAKDNPSAKGDKKVQFAKNLEQGPSGSAKATENVAAGNKTNNPRTVQGVKIDDKKIGKGPACKKGDKVGMRYIGKLTDGKVFDCMSCKCSHSIYI